MENSQSNVEPTLEQAQQTLEIPLAFFDLPAGAGFTSSQKADVAQVADQFVNALGQVTENPADPAYAARFFDAQELADQQVWAVSGQDAYMALINARAQAAGNAPGFP